MSLLKILVFAAMTGISFALAYRTGGDQSPVGFSILNVFLQNINPTIQMWITILSGILTVFFIYRLAGFFRQIYENKIFGIVTALLGFSGSMLVVLAPQTSNIIVLGVALWLCGVIVVFYKKKSS